MNSGNVFEGLGDLTVIQKVTLAILAAKEVCKNREFLDWSSDWLLDKENARTSKTSRDMAIKLIRAMDGGSGGRPVSLTRSNLSTNARQAASSAAKAAAAIAMLPPQAKEAENFAADALKSAMLENKSIELFELARRAREVSP